ncbi:MAG TPA: glycosyl hydrolase 108 family protein [Rhodocyclaceae bacterium]|nr:glycosyl hydrolase 108 family protein [Rhodocyclaceae bacterium]
MADFSPAFEAMIQNEGGYKLSNVANDRSGQTYAGISRNFHAGWAGWTIIDRGDMATWSSLVWCDPAAGYW